jgi:hypothetical protein
MSFKKMRLMDEGEYLRMKDQQTREYDPEIRTLTLLKNEINDLLNNDKMSVAEKVKLIDRAQVRFDNIRNLPSDVEPTPTPMAAPVAVAAPVVAAPVAVEAADEQAAPVQAIASAKPTIDEEMKESLLANFDDQQRKRGIALIDQLQDRKDFAIEKGHPRLDSRLLASSKFNDIFKYMIKPTGTTPRGYKAFLEYLENSDIDRDLYTHFANFSPKTPAAKPSLPSLPPISKGKAKLNRAPPGTPVSVLHVYNK